MDRPGQGRDIWTAARKLGYGIGTEMMLDDRPPSDP